MSSLEDDDLDADVERLLTKHRNRKALGFSYYETNGRRQPKAASTPRVRTLAGACNWRHRPISPREAEQIELVSAFALAGLTLRQST